MFWTMSFEIYTCHLKQMIFYLDIIMHGFAIGLWVAKSLSQLMFNIIRQVFSEELFQSTDKWILIYTLSAFEPVHTVEIGYFK